MPAPDALLAFTVAAFILIVIPGPSVLFVISRALAYGRRAALTTGASAVGDRLTWWEGFVVGLTNPKTAVFFAAVLPQFTDRSPGHAGVQMAMLGAIFALIALGSDTVWGLAAGAVRAWFARSTRRVDLVGGAAGLTMVGLGIGLALNGRKD